MRRGLWLAVTFAAATLVVVLGAVAAGALLGDGSLEPPAVENDQFDAATVLPAAADVGGEIRMESDASGERVIVDTAHNNDVTDREIAPLVGALATSGHQVRTYDGVRLLSLGDALSHADALLVVNPEQSFTHEELDAVGSFVDNGGRVMLAMDPGSRNALREGRGRLGETTIFSELGLHRPPGFLYNADHNENNYVRVFAEPAEDSPLADGVERAVLPAPSPVGMDGGRVALSTTGGTRLSTTGQTGNHPVVVHDDSVVFVGDASFLRPENAHHADNNVLIGNFADFLVEGDRVGADLPDSTPAEPAGNATATPGPDGNQTTG